MDDYNIKRVLPIDIGIINLAFCIAEFHFYENETVFELVHVEKTTIGTMRQTAHTLSENMVDVFR